MSTHALSQVCLKIVRAIQPITQQASEQGLKIRVACSGGPDSLALAAAVAVVARRDPALMAHAMIVDHQLQQASAQVAAEAAETVRELGLDAQVQRVDVLHSGEGPEAAARTARYQALRSATPQGIKPDIVLLGHTLDDQAETVLLGLARGSGTRSLAGMPAVFGDQPSFVRPLLGIRRAETRQACTDWGLSPWDDPQNAQDDFTRSRIRHRVMPMLDDELGPGIAQALARTAELARADADYLDELAAQQLALACTPAEQEDGGNAQLDCRKVAAASPALQGRIVRQWAAMAGIVELDAGHTRSILGLINDWHGQRGIDLPGARVMRSSGRLMITTHNDA